MRRSRERRRQGGVIVYLEIGQVSIADLVALGWLAVPDHGSYSRVDRAYRASDLGACNPVDGLRGQGHFLVRYPTQHDRHAGYLRVSAALRAERLLLRATAGLINGTFRKGARSAATRQAALNLTCGVDLDEATINLDDALR